MSIPDAAIEAADKQLRESILARSRNPDEGDLYVIDQPSRGSLYIDGDLVTESLARAAIEAAMPAIREPIAQEIEALPTMEPVTDKDGAPIDGLSTMIPPSRVKEDAARIVRGGTP